MIRALVVDGDDIDGAVGGDRLFCGIVQREMRDEQLLTGLGVVVVVVCPNNTGGAVIRLQKRKVDGFP